MVTPGEVQMIPALSRIWEACFGDSPEYIRFFMENRFPTCRSFVWLEAGEPAGAAYLLPCILGERPAYYGYAVGVLPEFQRRGICGEILRSAEEFCRHEGAVFFVLPRPGVEGYYLKRGFYPGFFHQFQRVQPAGVPPVGLKVVEAEAEEVVLLRDTFFHGPGYVAWDRAATAYALEEQRRCGGFAHVLRWQGERYLLFGANRGETLLLRETTLSPEQMKAVSPWLSAFYGVSELVVERPAPSFETGIPRGCCWNFVLDVPGWLGFDLA